MKLFIFVQKLYNASLLKKQKYIDIVKQVINLNLTKSILDQNGWS